ncbi:MAG: primosomal protein N', partial [Chlamydiales bacterium]|nr:primosomal protein N' [Chlamydiales bacterium]
NIPDFRSQESVFQLITQVAGRAGRGVSPGEVVIQTALPEHSTIQQAAAQDYLAFYGDEITTRKMFSYPPYCKIVKFLFNAKNEAALLEFATKFREMLTSELPEAFVCHPVVPSGHAKVKDLFRYQFLVRGPQIGIICQAIEQTDRKMPIPSSISRFVDVDPTHTF